MTSPVLSSALFNYLQNYLTTYLDMLRHMVSINSFTLNYADVNRLAAETAERFERLGFVAEEVASADYRYGRHLVLSRPAAPLSGGRPAPAIGLISHLDTVYPAIEEDTNNFYWRIEGDRIYGPGTYDIKGGTVMIYMIMDALRQFYPALFDTISWYILLNAAEEVLVPDFGDLCHRYLGETALAALVFEGGDEFDGRYQLVTSRKGMARFRINVEGRGAHAGTHHHHGANAIVQLADIIQQLSAITDYDRGLTLNIGTISGGTVVNRVPHQASTSIELRAFDPDVYDTAVNQVLAFNTYSSVKSPVDHYACRVHVDVEGRWAPWPENGATSGLVTYWNAAAADLGLAPVNHQARGGLSDGNWLWDRVPTIDGLGPAGANAHSSERSEDGSKDQEYVLASSFVPKAVLNILALVRLFDAWQTQKDG